jgi:hypothetical protein
MAAQNLFQRLTGASPVIMKWREPWCFRIRLRGDFVFRLGVVLACWMAATGVMLVLFAFNVNRTGLGLAMGLGAVFGAGPATLLMFFRRHLVSGTVWLREDALLRQRAYVSASLLGGNWVESEQWHYSAMAHCQLALGKDLGTSYSVLTVSDGKTMEAFGLPAKVDLRALVEHLSANGVRVSQGRGLPQQFVRSLNVAWPLIGGFLGAGTLFIGGGIYWWQTGGFADRLAGRPDDAGVPEFPGPAFDLQPPMVDMGPPRSSQFVPTTPPMSDTEASMLPPGFDDPPSPFGLRNFPPVGFNPSGSPPTALLGEESELLGGSGGSPFRTVSAEAKPLIGVRYGLGQWAGQSAIGRLEPICLGDDVTGQSDHVAAREGYAVGGLNVHAKQYVNAVQLVFMRLTDDGRLDPNGSYSSDWIGEPGTGEPQSIHSNGEPAIGIHGRRAAILDAVGLVY